VLLPGRGVSLSRSARFLHFGRHDPTGFADGRGVAKAYPTALGPATIHLAKHGEDAVRVRAWGPAAEHAIAAAPGLLGHHDDPSAFVPLTPDIARRFAAQRGLRLVRVAWPFDALVQIILQQRVRFVEAARAYRVLTKRHGVRAPGPFELTTALDAKAWARVPVHELPALAVDRKRIDTVRGAAKLAHHVDKVVRLVEADERAEARRILDLFPGIGPWTREAFLDQALGDPDAVSTGDVHLPRLVCQALDAPETRVPYSDERMLALLEPWRGQRARVVRLVLSSEGTFVRL